MTDTTNWICPNMPFGHDWRGGLTCHGCDATRTAADAITSLLAGSEGWDANRAAALVDQHRAEVLNKAVGRLRAIPVQCTALTGPAWYGTGWSDAIRALEDIADYQKPDDEAYPGELQRLRALALAVRVGIRKDSLPEVKRVMDAHLTWEKTGGDPHTTRKS